MTEDVLAEIAVNPEHLELLRAARFGSALVVTLGARGRAVGALSLFTDDGRRLAPDAVEVAEELATRLGVAIDNSRLFRERTEIARTLQASLLPPDLPAVPGLEIAARYTAGGAGIDVGGDFYDLFPLDQGRHVFVLGDVCGRGVQAATTAALARHTIRSAAITQPTPAAILGHVNDVLLRSQPSAVAEPRFCTAVVGTITPERDGFLLDLAVGGHPLPLLRRADGTVTPVGTPGSVLGIVSDPAATTSRVPIGPGDMLVAVTDGILEMRRDREEFGEDGVRQVLGQSGGVDAAAVAEVIETSAVNFASRPPSDDLAVLVLRVAADPAR
jgi:serine phosphatase RsbU (regulator of sigma subunit)